MYGDMKLAIWKYKLATVDEQLLVVPYPAKVLSVAEQYGNIVLYALVSPEASEERNIVVRIHGTGQALNGEIADYDFIGTVKLMDGVMMFHVFVGK